MIRSYKVLTEKSYLIHRLQSTVLIPINCKYFLPTAHNIQFASGISQINQKNLSWIAEVWMEMEKVNFRSTSYHIFMWNITLQKKSLVFCEQVLFFFHGDSLRDDEKIW